MLFLFVVCFAYSSEYSENKAYTSRVTFFEDSNVSYSIYSISQVDFINFDSVPKNFGFSKSAFWLQYSISNSTEHEVFQLFKINYPLLNDVRFYECVDSVLVDSIVTGEHFLFSTREVEDRNYVFKIHVNPNQTKTFYVRLYNKGETIRIPIEIEDVYKKTDFGTTQTFYFAIFFGYILFAFVFNGILFFEFKQKHYALLAAYILCMGVFLFIIDGFAFQFFWPRIPYLANCSMVPFSMGASAFVLYFSNVFLKYPKKFQIGVKILYVSAIIIGLWNLFPFPINTYSVFSANAYVLVLISGILYVSFQRFLSIRSHSNLVFMLSFLCFFAGVIVYILRNFGVFEISFIYDNSIKIGFAAQITLLTVSTIMQFREVSKKTNKFLEEMVNKRTQVIAAQNAKLKDQNKQVALQFKEIQQSMHYAQRLQHAILPSKYKFLSLFKDYLIIYVPRDIVSGDFYWISEKKSKTYIVTADCTGHGIPGGFLSMLGISFLNQIVSKNSTISPHEILNKLRVLFSETMNNDEESQTRDSMDITVCLFDHATKKMKYAGCFNSLYLVRNNTLQELSVDRISLRKDADAEDFMFNNHVVVLEPKDRVFMFTDGFIDQFGGSDDKRYTKKRFKDLICTTASESMAVQKQMIEDVFYEWKGAKDQVDDILILGIEI